MQRLISRRKIPVKIPTATAECWHRRWPPVSNELGGLSGVLSGGCVRGEVTDPIRPSSPVDLGAKSLPLRILEHC